MVDSEGVKAVVRHAETGNFLLLKRNETKDEYPGYWEFPGGGLEDEKPEEGALRELEEETGLEGEIIGGGNSFIWHSDHTGREIKSHSFLVEVQTDQVELSREHTEFEWLKLEEIFDKKHFPLIRKDLKHAGVQID